MKVFGALCAFAWWSTIGIDEVSGFAAVTGNGGVVGRCRRCRRRRWSAFESSSLVRVSESRIPKEVRAEIYEAESRTPAAANRRTRIVAFSVLTLLFACLASGNVLLTEMRNDGADLAAEGYGWTQPVPLLSSYLGGWFDVVGVAVFGTLLELEGRTREETAERIYDELERRRREVRDDKRRRGRGRGGAVEPSTSKGGVKTSAKQRKRLAALAEVVQNDDSNDTATTTTTTDTTTTTTQQNEKEDKEETKGIVAKLKDFYEKADTMAASQALLLNKELEDRGVLDKITDDTGLRVVGKDEAAQTTTSTTTTTQEMPDKDADDQRPSNKDQRRT